MYRKIEHKIVDFDVCSLIEYSHRQVRFIRSGGERLMWKVR